MPLIVTLFLVVPVTGQPNHPEVLGHLHVDHGSLTIADNTTTLRMMEHMRALAERGNANV